MNITEYLHRLEYIKGHQEASGNPKDFNKWRSEQWRLENSYSDAEDRQRISFNNYLNERFEQVRSSVSHIHSEIKKIKTEFSNRLLKVENYIIDKDVDNIIPNLVILSNNIKIERIRDYNVPVINISSINSLNDIINKSSIFPLDIFYLLKYNDVYYRYSNVVSPLDYIFSDLVSISDYRDFYICRHNAYGGKGVLFISKDDKYYISSGEFIDISYLDPFKDNSIFTEIDLETKKFKIDSYELTHKIFKVLDDNIVNKFKKPFTINGFKVSFTMNYNGDGEYLPVIEISKNNTNLFRGNFYSNEINIKDTDNQTNLIILKKILDKVVNCK
jgi:hypothetical protein